MSDLDFLAFDADNHYYEAARRLHPTSRPEARPPHRAVGRDRRAEVPRDRRPGQPRGGQPDVRPGRQGRRPVRVLPRQPVGTSPDGVPARARADPARVPRPRRPPGDHGRARPRADLAVPDARDDLRGAAQARPRGGRHHVPGLQPLARGGLGLRTTRTGSSPPPTSPWPTSTSPSPSSSGPSTSTPGSSSCARPPRRPFRRRGRRATRCSTRSGPWSTRPASPSSSTPATAATRPTATPRTGSRPTSRERASRPSAMLSHGAGHLRLPGVADLRQAVRPLPQPAGGVGRERLGVPRRSVPASCESTARKMPGYFAERPGRDVPAPRLDQPVLGGRRQRDGRA